MSPYEIAMAVLKQPPGMHRIVSCMNGRKSIRRRNHKTSNLIFSSCLYCSPLFAAMLFLPSGAMAQTITYSYDQGPNGVGRLSSIYDSTGSTLTEYDQRGNVVQTTKQIEGNVFVTKSIYDSRNRVTMNTYPDGEILLYSYNAAGEVENIGTYATNIQYNEFGQRTSITLDNGVTTSYTYDPENLRLTQLSSSNSAGAVLQDLGYSYDSGGNILSLSDNAAPLNSQNFSYDHLARLETATGVYGSLNYSYDAIGNMLCNSQISACSEVSPNYSYPASGPDSVRPHAVTQAGNNSYQYDVNGNMISGDGRSIVYNMDNRPISITVDNNTVSMAYDHNNNRVKKESGATITYYAGKTFEQNNIETVNYIFAGGMRVAAKHSDGRIVYYHGNHLGSTHVVTDNNGNIVEEIQFYPYGATFSDTGSENVKHKYTSQELDIETGLYYYNARYYDPVLARFASADSVGVTLSNPQSLNRYTYVNNNPLRYIDPTGHYANATYAAAPFGQGAGASSTGPGFGRPGTRGRIPTCAQFGGGCGRSSDTSAAPLELMDHQQWSDPNNAGINLTGYVFASGTHYGGGTVVDRRQLATDLAKKAAAIDAKKEKNRGERPFVSNSCTGDCGGTSVTVNQLMGTTLIQFGNNRASPLQITVDGSVTYVNPEGQQVLQGNSGDLILQNQNGELITDFTVNPGETVTVIFDPTLNPTALSQGSGYFGFEMISQPLPDYQTEIGTIEGVAGFNDINTTSNPTTVSFPEDPYVFSDPTGDGSFVQ